MKKRNIMILTIALSLILLIGSSYAYLKVSKESTNPYVMNVGTLEVTFEDNKTQQLQVQAKYPMTDAEGMKQNDELSFTIKNTGSVNVTYKVYIEETSTNPAFKSVMHYIDNKNDKGYSNVKVLETNKYIDEEGSLSVGQSATYKVKLWLGIDADNRYMDKTFKGKIVVELTQKEPYSLINKIKEKAYTDERELIAIDVTDKNDIKKCKSLEACAGKTIEYRYSGPAANNYLKLTDNEGREEDWRIIGIFTDEAGEEYLKVVRDEVLPETYLPDTYTINEATINGETKKVTYTIKNTAMAVNWNKNDSGIQLNRWEEAGLQYFLNTEHDDSQVPINGYLSYLSYTTKSFLVDKPFYLGVIHANVLPYDTAKEAYYHERDIKNCINKKGPESNNNEENLLKENSGCHVWSGNAASWSGRIGLMYPSDYGLSATEENWNLGLRTDTTLTNDNGYEDDNIKSTSWMYNTVADFKTNWIWFISSPSYGLYSALGETNSGFVNHSWVNSSNLHTVRPVLNLSYTTLIIEGDGASSESAYKIFEQLNN